MRWDYLVEIRLAEFKGKMSKISDHVLEKARANIASKCIHSVGQDCGPA